MSEKIIDNHLLLAIARVSMALVIPLGTLLWGMTSVILSQRAEAQEAKLVSLQTTLEMRLSQSTTNMTIIVDSLGKLGDNSSKLSDRLTVVETRQAINMANSSQYKEQIEKRLDKFESTIIDLTRVVTQLTATIQTERELRSGSNTKR